MKTLRGASVLGLLVLWAAAVYAAVDLTGTWNVQVDLGSQKGSPTFVLKQDGEKLTGTYSGALGESAIAGTVKSSDVAIDFEASGAKIHLQRKSGQGREKDYGRLRLWRTGQRDVCGHEERGEVEEVTSGENRKVKTEQARG